MNALAPSDEGRDGFGAYRCVSRGTNSMGNTYVKLDYGPDVINRNSYHYYNADGSFYFNNPDGSTYYNNGRGYERYTPYTPPPAPGPPPPPLPPALADAEAEDDRVTVKLEEAVFTIDPDEEDVKPLTAHL